MPEPEENSMGGCARAGSATAYVQSELGDSERTDFERHLASCAECSDEVAAARELLEHLRSAPDESEVDLVDGILARIPEDAWETAGRGGNGSAFKWASRGLQAAAVLVVGMALGLVALRGPDPGARPTGAGDGTMEEQAMEDAAANARATAVSRALAWLASTQGSDGSWDAEAWGGQEHYTPALTGLATLALLADAPLDGAPRDAARADAVTRAADYLARAVGRSGRIGPRFDAALYNHGIATVALLEAYALTRDEALAGPISRALAYIRSEQTSSGGWGYAGGRQPNTAISVWQVNALLLAAPLGWPEARDPAVRGLAWLEGMIDAEGRAGYDARGRFPNGPVGLTAMAALSLVATEGAGSLLGSARARAARSLIEAAASTPRDLDYYRSFFLEYALRAVEKSSPGAEGQALSEGRPALTGVAEGQAPSEVRPALTGVAEGQALSEGRPALTGVAEGQAPSEGRPALTGVAGGRSREMIVGNQVKSGPHSGSFEPRDRWSATGGRVYSTAMAALSLQAHANAPRMIAMMRGSAR